MQMLKFHAYAELFPLMEEKELNDLAEDIKEHGQQEPIKLLDGHILDGRNRYQACLKADIEPKFEIVDIKDPLKYVLSINLHRRHLSESQRALVAAKISNVQICTSEKMEKITQQEAADLMNVSRRSVSSAVKVQEKGTPELRNAVENGDIPVSVAAEVCESEPHKQNQVASMKKKARKEAVKKEKPTTYSVSVTFTDEEMKKVDSACKRLKGGNRVEFIHGIVMSLCTEGMPPKKADIPNHQKNKKTFIQNSYSERQMAADKETSDIEKEYEHFVSNLPTATQKMSAEALNEQFQQHISR